jgi:hypothetical protein
MARLATENFVRGVLHHVRHRHVYERPNNIYYGYIFFVKYYVQSKCTILKIGASNALNAWHADMEPCRYGSMQACGARAAMR